MGIVSTMITGIALIPIVYDAVSNSQKSTNGVHLTGEVLKIGNASDPFLSATKLHVAFAYQGKEQKGVIRIPSDHAAEIRSDTGHHAIELIYVPLTKKVFAASIPNEMDWRHIAWCVAFLTLGLLSSLFFI